MIKYYKRRVKVRKGSENLKFFRNVFKLYKLDWNRIFHNKITFIFVIALFILPSMYAWFNIAALWDPYSNTKDIPIAVYSDDKKVEIFGKEVNVGDELIKNLKNNDKIGWKFVKSRQEIDEGVKDGRYFAGVYIPENFSENLTSFVDGDIKKPDIEYSVNQKINAIAPKITDKGVSSIQSEISEEFINTVSDTIMSVFNDAGFKLDKNLISINKVKTMVLYADENMSDIDKYANEIRTIHKKMPEFKEKLNKSNEFIEYLPEVNDASEKIKQVNEMVPEIEEGGKMILDIQKKIPEIENAGRQLAMIDEDFSSITKMMDDTIVESRRVIDVIDDAREVIPDIENMNEKVNTTIPKIENGVNKIQSAMPDISVAIESGIDTVKIVSKDVLDITVRLANFVNNSENEELLESNKDFIVKNLNVISDYLNFKLGILDSIKNVFESLNINGGLDLKVQKIEKNIYTIEGFKNVVNGVEADIDSYSIEELINNIDRIKNNAENVNSMINSINIADIRNDIENSLTDFEGVLSDADNITGKIMEEDTFNEIDSIMGNAVDILNQAISLMEKYQEEMPAIREEIHSANIILNNNMNLIISGINQAAYIYNNDFPKIKNKLNDMSKFINKDLPVVEHELTNSLSIANEKFPEFEKAVNMANDFVEQDLPEVKKGINKAADAIRKGEKEVDIGELIKLMKNDAKKEADFISNPVNLSEKDIYPIPNYGSASTPFYTVLCLWVGALLLASLTTVSYHLEPEEKKKFTMREIFTARLFTYLTVSFFQAIIVTLGNLYLLKIYCKNPLEHILFSIFTGFIFTTIIYSLVALFDNLGKGAAVIILVLSISGGGGNFPIQMSGPFFRKINPYLPFTYAVNLIRETVGGIYEPTVVKMLIALVGFGFIFLMLGLFAYPYIRDKVEKIMGMSHDGYFLH